MMMAEKHLPDRGQVNAEFTGILEHSRRTCAGVEEEAVAIHLYQGGKSPLAKAATIRQHGGQYGYL